MGEFALLINNTRGKERRLSKMAEQNIPDENDIVGLRKRKIGPGQIRKLETCAAEIFTTLGLDLNTDATRDTPRRYIEAMLEATDGYDGDPKLVKVFETECRGGPDCRLSQIIEGPILFFSLCEHHGLPFYGQAYVGYISHEHIIGISKLTRLVHLFTKRFAVQERIGQQIAETLNQLLKPHGVAVFLEAHHLCVEMRGVKGMAPVTRTTFWRGNYDTDAALRAEFLSLCGVKK
jgi:GTP cyclohydrolase I